MRKRAATLAGQSASIEAAREAASQLAEKLSVRHLPEYSLMKHAYPKLQFQFRPTLSMNHQYGL